MTRGNWFVALAVVAAMAQAVSGSPTLDLYGYVTGYYVDGTGSMVSIAPTTVIPTDSFISDTTQYRIDMGIVLNGTELSPYGLGNLTFNLDEYPGSLLVPGVHLHDVTSPSYRVGWRADSTSFAYHADEETVATASLWQANSDKGLSVTDLHAILIEVEQTAGELGEPGEDIRSTLGTPNDPQVVSQGYRYIGRIFVTWDGTPARLKITKGVGVPWSLIDLTTNLYDGQPAETMVAHSPVRFGGLIPEPATMVLLGLGGLLGFRRKRG